MPHYTLTVTENERLLLCLALGAITGRIPPIVAVRDEDPALPEQLIVKLISPGRENGGAGLNAATPSASVVPAPFPTQSSLPLQLKDHWADKANRATAESMEFAPSKVERKDTARGKRLMVSWQSNGRGYLQASCWDEALFGHIANRTKQKTLFYISRSQDGKYMNIIGVRA